MKRTSKAIAIAAAAALAFGSTGAMSFAAAPGGNSGNGGPGGFGGNPGAMNSTVSEITEGTMPQMPAFSGSAPADGTMPQMPDFIASAPIDTETTEATDTQDMNGQFEGRHGRFGGMHGQSFNKTDIAAKIIEENGLDLDVNNMTEDEINDLLEQYKPADDRNGKHNMGSGHMADMILNIITKIFEDYGIDFNTEDLTTDKISEYIEQFRSENGDENGRPERPDFQNSSAPAPNLQSGEAPVEAADNTTAA